MKGSVRKERRKEDAGYPGEQDIRKKKPTTQEEEQRKKPIEGGRGA
jgi:hypothetical protein